MDDHATPPVTPTQFHCVRCGYNLTGLTIGGRCPECGEAIENSLGRRHSDRTCGAAVACMILGILSLVACPMLGPVAIIFCYQAQARLYAGGYSKGSESMATAGFVMGIIGTVLGW